MLENEKPRCPWCPNPGGCEGCSLTGDDRDSYILVPQSLVKKQLLAERRKWLMAVSALAGMLLASLFVLVLVLAWTFLA